MGLFSRRQKPKIKIQTIKRDSFSGWIKCSSCHELIHKEELSKNFACCPKCGYHYRLSAKERIKSIADRDSFQALFDAIRSVDPLDFVDSRRYTERLEEAQENSGMHEAIVTGTCKLDGKDIAIAAMDFSFMGGSMGSVVGERLTALIEHALEHKLPLITVSVSGGARMQEAVLSLMQMAKTSAALALLNEAGIPYISILANPTSGGVTASFASLGDIILAEPGALICFAGPRVIEQTIKEKLPEGAQRAEFLLKHGMIDAIVQRSQLRGTLIEFVDYLTDNERCFKQSLTTEAELPQKLDTLITSSEDPVKQPPTPVAQ